MTISFNADEIFEMAERIEVNGAKFYRGAAEKFRDRASADVFQKLAAMEDEHRVIFAAMRKEFTDPEKERTLFDPDDDVKKYLRAIVDGKIFPSRHDPSDAFRGDPSIDEIVCTAIGLEKDSIIFYLGMKEMVPAKLGRDKIDLIIAEERNHILYLTELRK